MRESPGGLSMLKMYMKCPRAWAFKYYMGWIKENEKKSDSLYIGSAVHEAVAVYLTTKSAEKGLTKLIKEAPFNLLDRAKRAYEAWLIEHANIFTDYDLLSVEEQFNYVLPNGFEATLRVDRVVQSKETGLIYIVDIKFTAYSVPATEKTYMYSPQPLLYHVVPYYMKPEWAPQFRGWLTDIIYQRGKADAKTYVSEPVYYSKREVDAYIESLNGVVYEISDKLKLSKLNDGLINGVFTANRGDACTVFGSVCPYTNICLCPPMKGDPIKGAFVPDDPEFNQTVLKAFETIK